MKCILCIILLFQVCLFAGIPNDGILKTGWLIQSSEKINLTGDKISSDQIDLNGWFKTNLPSTVLAVLVRNNVYNDLFYGENLKSIPTEQFNHSWWYRTEFDIPLDKNITNAKLKFDGINYYANIWINGKLIAGRDSIYGAFRRFSIDITEHAKFGRKNILAVEVFPPVPGDYTMGFVDWNPAPPDKNMGLWREVNLELSGNVSVSNPYVKTKLDIKDYKTAELYISAVVKNNSNNKATGILSVKIDDINISEEVTLKPYEEKIIKFDPEEYSQLVVKNPRVWWTHDHGKQELYGIKLSFTINDRISSSIKSRFGIREVTDYFTDKGYRGYKLNGKKILIRGGGWVDNMLLDNTFDNLKTQVEYAVHMNLNTLRLEGFWGNNEDLYNLCDEKGILLMAGWSCQWEWEAFLGKPHNEYGGIMTRRDFNLLADSWKDQIVWLRNHPSILVWMYGSDKYPAPGIENEYVKIINEYDSTRPFLASAGNRTSTITGNTGVKMTGPYDYVPPVYWYTDTTAGGAFGFNTETGPGVQVPVIGSIKKFIPQDHLWPIDSVWYYHCGGLEFKNLNRFTDAMNQRLGEAASLEEYCTKAAFLNYEGMRAMYEAFISNKYVSAGVIQWMYNAAWPKFWWQLYDYFLVPNAAYYGARKANEPIHILYDYGDKGIKIYNNTFIGYKDLVAAVNVFNIDMSRKFSKTINIELPADTCIDVIPVSDIEGLSDVFFLDLNLYTKDGAKLSSNFYTLSTKEEILDYSRHEWFVTPAKQYADFRDLNNLPEAKLNYHIIYNKKETDSILVTIENVSDYPAFQVELHLFDENGDIVTPVFWEDNYFTILPGQKISVDGIYKNPDGGKTTVIIKGWNLKE